MASTWRLARSLEVLLAEVDARWPGRSKRSDGTIGDAAHAARKSDHNPNAVGVVRALDITHDPAGCRGDLVAEYLRTLGEAGDDRLNGGGYVIWNRLVAGAGKGWVWRPYTGPSPHTDHVHVSASRVSFGYDSTRPWRLSTARATSGSDVIAGGPPLPPAKADVAVLSLTMVGEMFSAQLEEALTDSKLIRTIEGASSVVVTVRDRKRVLLRSLGSKLAAARVVVGGVVYELAGMRKKGDELTFTFEDQVAATLRRQRGFKASVNDLITRTEFAQHMLADPPAAANNFVDARWVEFRGEPAQTALPYAVAGAYIDPRASLSRGTQDDPNTESTWDCLGRLARDISWRRFSDGRTLYFGSDEWLRSLRVPIALSEFDEQGRPTLGVTRVDFGVDVGLPTSEVTVDMNFTRDALPAGGSVDLAGCGAADGAYIIKETTRPLHSPQGSVTLQRPIAAVLADLPVYDPGGGDHPDGTKRSPDVPSSQQLTDAEIARVAYTAGWRGPSLIIAIQVCLAESGGDNSSMHPNFAGDPQSKYYGSIDRGLWQINNVAHPEYEPLTLVTDPQYNANAAYDIWRKANHGFTPWSAFKNGSYQGGNFAARAAAAARTIPGHTGGWN